MPRKLIFVNRFFYPDHSATSQILSDLAFQLAKTGEEVHVIAGRQLYDDPAANLPGFETINHVLVHRVWASRFGRARLVGRMIDYLFFYAAAVVTVLRLARKADVVVVKTDPPLLSVATGSAARLKGAQTVNWLQDLFPEVAIALGVRFLRGGIGKALTRLRDGSVRRATANVVISQRMAEHLASQETRRGRLYIVANWAEDHVIAPTLPADNSLRAEWRLNNKFVVAYSGNLGRAHEFETILGAAELLQHDPRFVYLFVGGGHLIPEVIARVRQMKLERLFQFRPYQDRLNLSLSLGVPDVHWLSLRAELEGLILPSKFYGIAAAGRPMIAITAEDSEISRLIRSHQCGVAITIGDSEGLADALSRLADDPKRSAEMGRNARRMLDLYFSRERAFSRWQRVIEECSPQVAGRHLDELAVL